MVTPSRPWPLVDYLCDWYWVGGRYACMALRFDCGRYCYRSHKKKWVELRARIRYIAQSLGRCGYW